jgi:LuxR family maltose regulon positive regulatory protein
MQGLDEGFKRKLTLVSAPAGFGKTILLSDWAQNVARPEDHRAPTPVAWLSLDGGDNDPIRFWGHVLTALDRLPALTGAATEALAMLSATPPVAIETALTALINALVERERLVDIALVLDDYHLVSAPPIHAAMAFLLDHLPPQMHLLIASRADPPLSLARLRARGHLLELRAHDLQFTPEEAAAFLNDVMRLGLSPGDVAELEARTEGWITGLQLAALSLQGHGDPRAVVQTFTGQHHFVFEYLMEEVLGRQPERVRHFLQATSVLERLSGSLCEAVTGQPDGSAVLAQLWHDNLFVEPLDEAGQWYRRHHLLAEVLLAQLHQTQPDLIPELHRRARDWYAQHGHLHEAIRHAQAGGDHAWMVDLIEREYRQLIARGELVTLRRWLDSLPPDLLRARPRMCVCYAWAMSYSSRSDVLEGYLAQAEEALTGLEGEAVSALRGEILALRAIEGALRGQANRVVELAQQALELISDQDMLARALVYQALGHAHRLQGQPLKARRAFEATLALGSVASKLVPLAATLRLGQVEAMQGGLHEAAQTLKQSLQAADAFGGQTLLYSAEAHVRLGDILREWTDFDAALEHVLKGIELARRADNVIAILSGYFTLTHVRAARGETALAWEALGQAEALALRYDFPHLEARVASHRAWLGLIAGDVEAAVRWADAYAANRAQLHDQVLTDFQDTLLARTRLRQRRAREAYLLLTEVLAEAEAAGRGWMVIQCRALQALALQAQGQSTQALEALARALSLAAPEGYVQLFLDEGQPMRRLLSVFTEQAAVEDTARAFAKRLLSAFAPPAPVVHAPMPPSFVEALSTRELEVLRLMAEGRSNQAVAETLVISVGTVKSHINRILGKLDARNRTEAVARAHTLQLL